MKLTAAIPTYNGASRISRALRSIRAQTRPPDEVLIVDDASSIDLAPALQSFSDLPIRIVRHRENRRDSGARNTAMREATGDFIAFLDDDDEWLPEKLAQQLVLLSREPENNIAFCPFIRVHLATGREELMHAVPADWRRYLLYFGGLGSGSTMLLSKAAFDRVGQFDESMPRLSDCDWLLRAHEAGISFRFTLQPQARVLLAEGSSGDAAERGARAFLRKHEGLYRREGSIFAARARASILTRIARRYLAERRWIDALRLTAEALPYHPPFVAAKLAREGWRYLTRKRSSPPNAY